MRKISKVLTGAAAAAMVTLGAAAPAEAQYRYGDRYYHRDRGIDVGDVVAGVAIVGGIAAIASAVSNSNRGYGYSHGGYSQGYGYNPGYGGYNQGYGYGNYGYGPQAAVQACSYQAQRYGGRVSITDVDQRNARRYRVHGVVDSGGYYNRGYGRTGFTCTARDDGRVTNFRTSRY